MYSFTFWQIVGLRFLVVLVAVALIKHGYVVAPSILLLSQTPPVRMR